MHLEASSLALDPGVGVGRQQGPTDLHLPGAQKALVDLEDVSLEVERPVAGDMSLLTLDKRRLKLGFVDGLAVFDTFVEDLFGALPIRPPWAAW